MHCSCDRLNLQFSGNFQIQVLYGIYAGILIMVKCSHALVLLLISLKYQGDISAILPFVAVGNNGKTGLSQLPLPPPPPYISLCLRALVSGLRGSLLLFQALPMQM